MSKKIVEYYQANGPITADEIAALAGAEPGTPVFTRMTTRNLDDLKISFVGSEIVNAAELGTSFRASFVEGAGFVRAKRAGTIEGR